MTTLSPRLFDLVWRLLLAALCGGVIGFQRKWQSKDAGVRTHVLIAIGASVAMVISKYGFFAMLTPPHTIWRYDPSRIASQVIPGIGFLGSGAILDRRHGVIDGLSTAAGLWVTACLGLAAGDGMVALSIWGTVGVVTVQLLGGVLDRMAERHRKVVVHIHLTVGPVAARELMAGWNQHYFAGHARSILDGYDGHQLDLRLYGTLKNPTVTTELFTELMACKQVADFELN